MIRITLLKDGWTTAFGDRVPPRTEMREFADAYEAATWFTEDSYFAEPYTRFAIWERIDTEASLVPAFPKRPVPVIEGTWREALPEETPGELAPEFVPAEEPVAA